jgi:hypothetical protein
MNTNSNNMFNTYPPYQKLPDSTSGTGILFDYISKPTNDLSIRKAANGFIISTFGSEHVFETIDSLNKFISEFYSKA